MNPPRSLPKDLLTNSKVMGCHPITPDGWDSYGMQKEQTIKA